MTDSPVNDSEGHPLGFDDLPDAPPPRQDVKALPDLGFQTYYELLRIAPDSTQSEIKDAYRETLKRVHPDLGDPPHAEFLMARVQEAGEVLLDTETRKTYHAVGHWRFIKQHTDREVSIPSHATIEPISEPVPDLLPERHSTDAAPESDSEDHSGGRSITGGLSSIKESLFEGSREPTENAETGTEEASESRSETDGTRTVQESHGNRAEAGAVIDELLEGSGGRPASSAEVYDVSREFDSVLGQATESEARFRSVKRLYMSLLFVPLGLLGAGLLLGPVPIPLVLKIAIFLVVAPIASLAPIIGFRYIAPQLVDDVHRERVRTPNSRAARRQAVKYGVGALLVTVLLNVVSVNGAPWAYFPRIVAAGGIVGAAPWVDLSVIDAPALTVPVNLVGGGVSVGLPLLSISAGLHAFILEPLHERLVMPEYRVVDIPNAMGGACVVMASCALFVGVLFGTAPLDGGNISVIAMLLGLLGIATISGTS